MRYAGFTDEPEKRKQQQKLACDFIIAKEFMSKADALQWEKNMSARGYRKDRGGKGWKYGYIF